MGACNVRVNRELRSKLYNEAASLRPRLSILADNPHDHDDLHQLHIITDKLGPGFHGQMCIVMHDDGDFSLEKEVYDFWET